jgi:Phage gp6-like head-tail connector protein
MGLVAFDVAKDHLRITDLDHDVEIQRKLDIASAEIADFIGAKFDPTWDEDSTPLVVQASVLKLLGARYEHRGDDASTSDNHESALWDEITRMLMRVRDPVFA